MKEEMYRTPKIEEFVNGFEYQIAKIDDLIIRTDENHNNYFWSETRIWDEKQEKHHLEDLIEIKSIRTKKSTEELTEEIYKNTRNICELPCFTKGVKVSENIQYKLKK